MSSRRSPAAGSTITSESASDHSYQLASSYTNNNAFLIDQTATNATVTFTSPAAYSALSFLGSAGNGAVTVGTTVHHADGTTELLREGGMVIGPSPDAHYMRGFATLRPGSAMVLYTDGITECHHPRTGEEFGLRRLEGLVRKHAARPAAEIVRLVFDAITRYAGNTTKEDDQTLVIVRRPSAQKPSKK